MKDIYYIKALYSEYFFTLENLWYTHQLHTTTTLHTTPTPTNYTTTTHTQSVSLMAHLSQVYQYLAHTLQTFRCEQVATGVRGGGGAVTPPPVSRPLPPGTTPTP
jgi:hypothetical protein